MYGLTTALGICRAGCLLGVVLPLLGSCVAHPAEQIAADHRFAVVTVAGVPFLHRVFLNRRPGRQLHVYLEGDGRPWHTRNRVALDPTPANPLMLLLMAEDDAPAIYLGRPCYHEVDDPCCTPDWWTDRRYSAEVVASLDSVIDHFAEPYQGVVLVGHSGGGTLAMLLAARRADVTAVVTLAGNLDIDAWADHHHYTRLSGSLNPATLPPLDSSVRQLHLVGERDETVTPLMLENALTAQPGAELRVIPGVDHSCCWSDLWPDLLVELGR